MDYSLRLLPREKVTKSLIFDGCGVKKLAAQGILTYIAIRTLPYHLYADECGLLVLTAPLTSASLSKNKFFDRLKAASPAR